MPRKRGINIQKISRDLNLSTATISRVLNKRPEVNEATRLRVENYLQKANYQPPVPSYDFRVIGFIDSFSRHKINSYYLSDILEGADERLHALGYHTLLIHADGVERDIVRYGRARIFEKLDGILWLEPMFNRKYAKIVEDQRIPCVVINNSEPNIPIDLVESNNIDSGRKAVEYLVDNNHRTIGFIGGWMNMTNHRDRYLGFLEGMKAAGLKVNEDWIINDITLWNDEGGATGMHRLLSRKDRPTAVVLCSDFLATGAFRAVEERGASVPEDISIISFDDFPLASYLSPPLTTFRQPLQEMGMQAADRLLKLLSEEPEEAPSRLYIDCPFVVRGSVKHMPLR